MSTILRSRVFQERGSGRGGGARRLVSYQRYIRGDIMEEAQIFAMGWKGFIRLPRHDVDALCIDKTMW